MRSEKGTGIILKAFASAAVVWLLTALFCTTVCTAILCRNGPELKQLGIAGSVISFAAAFAAGGAAIMKKKSRRLATGFSCGAVITVILLSIGLLTAGKNINSSAVISVSAFTLSGCLCGAVFCPAGRLNINLRRKKFT